MARPLEHVLDEIIRVADGLSKNPRLLTRTEFLKGSDVTKNDLEEYGGFSKLKTDAANSRGIEPSKDLAVARGVELRNSYYRSLERRIATADYLSDKLLAGMQKVFEDNPIVLPKKPNFPKKSEKPKRLLTLLWSDLHFGVSVDSREVLKSEFNWTIACRRMAKVCEQAAAWKPEHRAETELQIVLNGDILHGIIHLSEANIRPIIEQEYGATAILMHAIAYLRQHFKKIRVLCNPGNHDRMVYRGPERALSQRFDSYSHSVYNTLRAAFRTDKDITFDIPMAGMGTYKTPGDHLVFATHGDTAPATSNVGKSFDVARTSEAILKMCAGSVFEQKIDVVLFGHWHQPSVFMLQDGTVCVVNGSLIGSDPYAQNAIGYFNSMPAQIMFESVPGYPLGDFRIVQLRDADYDTSLDKIIYIKDIELGGLIAF